MSKSQAFQVMKAEQSILLNSIHPKLSASAALRSDDMRSDTISSDLML